MPDQIHLIITVRKPVPDRETAAALYEVVKSKLADHPSLAITGLVTNHFIPVEPTQ